MWRRQKRNPGPTLNPNHFQSQHIPVPAAKNAWRISFSFLFFSLPALSGMLFFYLTDIHLKIFFSPHHIKRNVACGPKQSLWLHRWNPRPMCQEHIRFNPIHLSKCMMILSVLSLGLECLKVNRLPLSQSQRYEQHSWGGGCIVCLWASLLKCSAVQKCPARHGHLQVHDDCPKASNGTLEPDSN